ncbi:cation diffusion facilitator family transporter [Dictyocaulus viviparus]|uniref:Cation diffusion facilitator family transporter n=1 Tax=Dictyocaulus viviparus TaxID=29172 RepID=A0A0D8XUZ6_DICVI|nr:cation diffusion facilitator family transporter [Dictyocaulus viviparus]
MATTVQRPKAFESNYRRRSKVGCWERRRRARAKAKYYKELIELQEIFEYDNRLIEGNEIILELEKGPDRILTRITLLLNIVLLFVNLYAAAASGSLSIVSTFVDSFMDITTSLVLNVCLWLIHNTNSHKYPRGRERLELLGVILCSMIMGIANMFLIMQSISAIITGKIETNVNLLVLAAMISGSLIKSILMIVCYKRGSTTSKVIAMDMRNDVATSLVAIFAATVGDIIWPYADPVGAIIVCGLIAVSWFHHALQHVPILVGVRAERDQLARILRLTVEHDERIRYIHHAMVYHTGMQATVELHIVMDENLPLKVTHDIAHTLEEKLVKLDFVERAFVHCDYDCDE